MTDSVWLGMSEKRRRLIMSGYASKKGERTDNIWQGKSERREGWHCLVRQVTENMADYYWLGKSERREGWPCLARQVRGERGLMMSG